MGSRAPRGICLTHDIKDSGHESLDLGDDWCVASTRQGVEGTTEPLSRILRVEFDDLKQLPKSVGLFLALEVFCLLIMVDTDDDAEEAAEN